MQMNLTELSHPEFWTVLRSLDQAIKTISPITPTTNLDLEGAPSTGSFEGSSILNSTQLDRLTEDFVALDGGLESLTAEGFSDQIFLNSTLGFGHLPDFSFEDPTLDWHRDATF